MFHRVMGQNNIECTVGEAGIPIDALDHTFQPEDFLGTQTGPVLGSTPEALVPSRRIKAHIIPSAHPASRKDKPVNGLPRRPRR